MTAIVPMLRGDVASHPQPSGEARLYELMLVAAPSATTCADLLVRFAARKWHLDSACERDVAAVAKNLVDHAVDAAPKQPVTKHVHLESLSLITFRLVLAPRAVITEVWDCGTNVPDLFPIAGAMDGGCHLLGPGRRVLWCAVRLGLSEQPDQARTAAGMPRRERLQGPVQPSVALRDADLLQRILHRLRALDVEG